MSSTSNQDLPEKSQLRSHMTREIERLKANIAKQQKELQYFQERVATINRIQINTFL